MTETILNICKNESYIYTNYLIHYRLEFCEESQSILKLFVHSGEKIANNSKNFKEIILPMKKFGPFFIQENLLETLKQEKPEKIVGMFDIRWLAILRCMFYFEKKLDWIWWGLDTGSIVGDFFKKLLLLKSNKVIFYNNQVKAKFKGFDK